MPNDALKTWEHRPASRSLDGWGDRAWKSMCRCSCVSNQPLKAGKGDSVTSLLMWGSSACSHQIANQHRHIP